MAAGINRLIRAARIVGQAIAGTNVRNAPVADENGCVAEFARLGGVSMV
jgi:hypothetical protein